MKIKFYNPNEKIEARIKNLEIEKRLIWDEIADAESKIETRLTLQWHRQDNLAEWLFKLHTLQIVNVIVTITLALVLLGHLIT